MTGLDTQGATVRQVPYVFRRTLLAKAVQKPDQHFRHRYRSVLFTESSIRVQIVEYVGNVVVIAARREEFGCRKPSVPIQVIDDSPQFLCSGRQCVYENDSVEGGSYLESQVHYLPQTAAPMPVFSQARLRRQGT